jgi:hypothetical protein
VQRKQGTIFALTLLRTTHQPPEQRFIGKLRVGTGHGVAAQQEASWPAIDEAVEKKSACPQGEHDLARVHVINGAARDLDHIARPKSGQHAFPTELQT